MSIGGKCYSKSVEKQTDHEIKKIYNVLMLCGGFMVLEIWGHWASNTLSLLADSMHLFADLLGLIISLLALRWTKKKPSYRFTFGYGRIEILGAMFSTLLIWIVVGYLVFESYYRYSHPHQINEKVFVVISMVGFVVNLASVFFLHETSTEHASSSKSLNIRATYVHIIGDLVQSAGVLAASMITYIYPKAVFVDIICTIIFSVIVLFTTLMVLKDGLEILLEMTPKKVNISSVKGRLREIENVYEVVDAKAWSVSVNITSATATLLLEDVYIRDYEKVLREAKKIMQNEYAFDFFNIQIETFETYYESKLLEDGKVKKLPP